MNGWEGLLVGDNAMEKTSAVSETDKNPKSKTTITSSSPYSMLTQPSRHVDMPKEEDKVRWQDAMFKLHHFQ